MKTKNVVLGISAFALAVSTAFASLNLGTIYEIQVQYSGAVGCPQANVWNCIDIDRDPACSGGLTQTCLVTVTGQFGNNYVASCHSDGSNCANLQKHTSSLAPSVLFDTCINNAK